MRILLLNQIRSWLRLARSDSAVICHIARHSPATPRSCVPNCRLKTKEIKLRGARRSTVLVVALAVRWFSHKNSKARERVGHSASSKVVSKAGVNNDSAVQNESSRHARALAAATASRPRDVKAADPAAPFAARAAALAAAASEGVTTKKGAPRTKSACGAPGEPPQQRGQHRVVFVAGAQTTEQAAVVSQEQEQQSQRRPRRHFPQRQLSAAAAATAS
eukprot:CAMPEP_0171858272 /NCGR_PEP_ID=MMETSP0992-20121227/25202_1 /TAXON_ID=483369 /ORGANISM="non described non described, Strain CCMP2098" /LENGTH=218 /DNA_ID=CAMNT_0012479699 /DNA_START=176 /DNA_END=829 /DNA_ORIENTATION=+